jgi:predicted HTH transcriptional regulator
MKESLLSEPKFTDDNDIVTLILKNNVSKSEETISEDTMKKIEEIFNKLNDTQKIILNFLIINKKATISEISENVSISERMIKSYLNDFIEI